MRRAATSLATAVRLVGNSHWITRSAHAASGSSAVSRARMRRWTSAVRARTAAGVANPGAIAASRRPRWPVGSARTCPPRKLGAYTNDAATHAGSANARSSR